MYDTYTDVFNTFIYCAFFFQTTLYVIKRWGYLSKFSWVALARIESEICSFDGWNVEYNSFNYVRAVWAEEPSSQPRLAGKLRLLVTIPIFQTVYVFKIIPLNCIMLSIFCRRAVNYLQVYIEPGVIVRSLQLPYVS